MLSKLGKKDGIYNKLSRFNLLDLIIDADIQAIVDIIRSGRLALGGEDHGFPRTRHALDLFRAGYAPTVVFSGGTLKDAGLACSSAQLSLEAARQLGLPSRSAVIAPEAQSTYDEALNLRTMAQEHEWQTLILVTDAFHTRRAARTFRAVMPGVSVRVSAAPDPRYDPVNWWRTENGLVSVFTELIKLIFYWTKYGIRPF